MSSNTTMEGLTDLPLPSEMDLSIEDIKLLMDRSAQILSKRQESDRDEAKLTIVQLVKQNKIPFSDLVSILGESHAVYASSTDTGKSKKLYIDPDNRENIWNGIGRHPTWVKEKLNQGVSLDSLYVEVSDDKDQQFFYFNPEKPIERWNGTGRKPHWFKKLEEQGANMEQYKTIF